MFPSLDTMLDAAASLVETETPTGDLEALNAGFARLSDLVANFTGRGATVAHVDGVPYLHLPAEKTPTVLVIGHLDTVWPIGTLKHMPFRVLGGRVTGPGIFDMKAGLVIAMAAIAGCSVADHVSLLVTGDEETGSNTGRGLVQQFSSTAIAVLVPEPSAPGGAIKMARKGVGMYELAIRGREAHAGLEPELGINATVELGSLIADLVRMQDVQAGTTVTPTKASSGLTANTVPSDAVLSADVRAWSMQELQRVDHAVRARLTAVEGAEVTVTGGINRPPLEASTSLALVKLAQQAARDLGMPEIDATSVGGGSDGNFSAALGIPTLDGVGAVGGGAHSRDEWMDIACLPARAQWLAAVCEQVVSGGLNKRCGEPSPTK